MVMATLSYLGSVISAMIAVPTPAPSSFAIHFLGRNAIVEVSHDGSYSRFDHNLDDNPSFSLTFPRQQNECGLLTLVTNQYNSEDVLIETTIYGKDTSCSGSISNSHAVDITYDGHNSASFRPLSLDEQVQMIGLYALLQREDIVSTTLRAAGKSLQR